MPLRPAIAIHSMTRTGKAEAYSLTDCGNAERLVDQHGAGIRFCRDVRCWLAWDGSRWIADEGIVVQLAKKTVRAMQHERRTILTHLDDSALASDLLRTHADAVARWGNRSEGTRHIMGMIRLAESDPRVSSQIAHFDRNPWLLNVLNGTIELRTAVLREHRPEDFITKQAGCEHSYDAVCPHWEKFLREVFEPHTEIIPFIQRAVGYSLTGDTREECMFVLVGKGRNGKSTFLGVIDELLGEYSGIAEIETFLAARGRPLREDIADMRGRRFVSGQEPLMTGTFAESTLKWLTGGDKLRARRLYEHSHEFRPSHKLWLAANALPRLSQDDWAAWSRLRVIPFDVSFQRRPNRGLKQALRHELPGILRWALVGCLAWLQDGLQAPAAVAAATTRSRKEQAVCT